MNALAILPGTKLITVACLPIADRAAEIEKLAAASGLTRYATEAVLRSVACESLRGDALWEAWLEASRAIACRDADRAESAIHALVHGATPARGSAS